MTKITNQFDYNKEKYLLEVSKEKNNLTIFYDKNLQKIIGYYDEIHFIKQINEQEFILGIFDGKAKHCDLVHTIYDEETNQYKILKTLPYNTKENIVFYNNIVKVSYKSSDILYDYFQNYVFPFSGEFKILTDTTGEEFIEASCKIHYENLEDTLYFRLNKNNLNVEAVYSALQDRYLNLNKILIKETNVNKVTINLNAEEYRYLNALSNIFKEQEKQQEKNINYKLSRSLKEQK